jgi:hypothetical protein
MGVKSTAIAISILLCVAGCGQARRDPRGILARRADR